MARDIDIIENARDAAQKAQEMLYNFFDTDACGAIKHPLDVMHGIFDKSIDSWGDEERILFDWVGQRRSIPLTLNIAFDYVNKITDTLDQLPNGKIQKVSDETRLSA